MRSATVRRAVGSVACLLAMSWAIPALAQLGPGTTWVRTDAYGKGITLSVEACCNGGLRLVYQFPPMGDQRAMTLTVDSPMNGVEAPALVAGKPTGQTMALKRVDDHHYSAIVKMNGQPYVVSNGTVSPDGKTMTVETASQGAGKGEKIIETWVRK